MNKEEKEMLICGLNATEIEVLKQEHGFLILGTVVQGENTYNAIFKEPTNQVLKAVSAVSKTDENQAAINLYNNCLVKSDDFGDRDIIKLRLAQSITKHLESFGTKVKNL